MMSFHEVTSQQRRRFSHCTHWRISSGGMFSSPFMPTEVLLHFLWNSTRIRLFSSLLNLILVAGGHQKNISSV